MSASGVHHLGASFRREYSPLVTRDFWTISPIPAILSRMHIPLPELVRRAPSGTLRAAIRVPVSGVPGDVDDRLADAAAVLGLRDLRVEARCRYTVELPWKTHVYGVLGARVTETVVVTITTTALDGCLKLECVPLRTHDAHAAGAAGVLAFAAAFGVGTYPAVGLMPAATLVVGGGLWTDATRTMAMTALERRLEQVATELASAVWPGAPPWPGGAAGVGQRLPSAPSARTIAS